MLTLKTEEAREGLEEALSGDFYAYFITISEICTGASADYVSLQFHLVPTAYTGQLLGASNALCSWLDLGGRCLAVVIIHSVTFHCSSVRLLFTKLCASCPGTPSPAHPTPNSHIITPHCFLSKQGTPWRPTLVVLFILTFGISSKVPESFRIICLILFISSYCWPRCA